MGHFGQDLYFISFSRHNKNHLCTLLIWAQRDLKVGRAHEWNKGLCQYHFDVEFLALSLSRQNPIRFPEKTSAYCPQRQQLPIACIYLLSVSTAYNNALKSCIASNFHEYKVHSFLSTSKQNVSSYLEPLSVIQILLEAAEFDLKSLGALSCRSDTCKYNKATDTGYQETQPARPNFHSKQNFLLP